MACIFYFQRKKFRLDIYNTDLKKFMDVNIPKLNVNVGLYLISLLAIGFGEYYCLTVLFWFGIISGGISLISIIWILPAYVKRYLKKG